MRYRCEAWELDWDLRELRYDGAPVHVEPKVLSLLSALMERAGRVMTREELQGLLWPGVSVSPDALQRLVHCARVAIRDDSREPRILVTRRGHGIVFLGTVSVTDTCRTPRPTVHDEGNRAFEGSIEESTVSAGEHHVPSLAIHWMIPRLRVTTIQRSTTMVLGRASSCDEILDGTSVSREHARCTFRGPVPLVRDLNSRNGTYVNGRPVTETPLTVNDALRIGDWLGIVRRVPSPEDVRFDLIRDGFYVGHETRMLLKWARSDRAGQRFLNIWGEPGTGKTSLARTINTPERANQRSMIVQCRRVIEDVESNICAVSVDELLGSAKSWDWRAGTLVLDNIDHLDAERARAVAAMIAKSDDCVDGSTEIITTSTERVAALTVGTQPANPCLTPLTGVELPLLPLRQRRSDIVELARVFLKGVCDTPWGISTRAAECLVLYPWPSNVTELRRVVRQVAPRAMADRRVEIDHLPAEIAAGCRD